MADSQVSHQEKRLVMTPFGLAEISGPFADDYTKLKWEFKDHWSGESARFQVAGLEVFVRDMDGDSSWWELRDNRTGLVLAKGEKWPGETELPDFWQCLVDAEAALRAEVHERKQRLIFFTQSQ